MNYDIIDPSIRCLADHAGAKLFTIYNNGRDLRVLTFDLETAERLAANYEPTNDAEDTLL